MFANKLLRTFQQQGRTIVYEHQDMQKRYLLPPNGPISEGSFHAFQAELKDENVVYMCYCGKADNRNPVHCNALTIVLSSPNVQHY